MASFAIRLVGTVTIDLRGGQRALRGLDADALSGVIDQRHHAPERERAGGAIGRHQRAIAAADAPVDVGVLVGVHVEDRDLVELAAVDVGRDRIDHRVPAIAGFETETGGSIAAVPVGFRSGLLGAIVEGVERADEIVAVLLREGLAVGTLAPRRQILVDLEIERFGDFDEGVSIRRVQPAAADVEGDLGRSLDGMRPAADAVTRLQHDDGEAGILQRIRGAKARGAGADDGNIDRGGEGRHAQPLARSRAGKKPTVPIGRYIRWPCRPGFLAAVRCGRNATAR